MPTYPLAFPAVGIQSSTFGLLTATSSSVSPFTFRQQVYNHTGVRWEGQVTFRPMTHAQAGLIKAFIADLVGQYGTFLYGDPDFLALGARGALGGTPLVKGASQTGTTLNIDGATALVSNWIRAGDYFQLGTGTGARLYMVTQDANSDSSGNVTLNFQPPLRSSPADNAPLTITGAKGVMRLASNKNDWSSNFTPVYDATIGFVEAISE